MRARERNVQEGQKRLGNTLGHRPEAFPPARGKKEGLHGRKAPGVRRETELQRRATTVGSTDKLRLTPNASRLTPHDLGRPYPPAALDLPCASSRTASRRSKGSRKRSPDRARRPHAESRPDPPRSRRSFRWGFRPGRLGRSPASTLPAASRS